MDVYPGNPSPMGATLDRQGVNFAVYSASAAQGEVVLCLFADDGTETQLPMEHRNGDVWHASVPAITAGQRYGYRLTGPWYPQGGVWSNQHKLLLDPWAKAIDGAYDGDPAVVAHAPNDRLSPDGRDSAAHVPLSVVVDPTFDWGTDKPPATALGDSVIYETHVRGISKQHPQVPSALQGTYAGLASAPVLAHLTSLGVTAVELMPVHQFVPEPTLLSMGLTEYWGYMTVGFFAPHGAYSSSGARGQQVSEFKAMVKALHAAGIEVILDVVYNHTGEGSVDGPSLAFRGLDNPTYYRLNPNDRSNYTDYSGTGNTVDAGQPEALRLIMSSLRYWATEMHVDGFRFDLAAVLARQDTSIERSSAFLDLVYQDPVISQVKLIAEPWDATGGYFLGQFPPMWAQWNDQYRGTIRDWWRANAKIGTLASRLAGSADVFQAPDLLPESSINYVTCHDGFTLTDLVSYDGKHNEANGQNNGDGTDDNRSWNCGEEGPSSDPAVVALRAQQRRNFLATLLVSQGVPMLGGGDEIGRTQGGNNNAYCQDNATTWYDWGGSQGLDQARQDLLAFTKLAVGLRRAHPVFRRRTFFLGQQPPGGHGDDIDWLWLDGTPMTPGTWNSGSLALGMWLNGSALVDTDAHGTPLTDDTFLVLFNASWNPAGFTLPPASRGNTWTPVLDTAIATGAPASPGPVLAAGAPLKVAPRSLVVLRKAS